MTASIVGSASLVLSLCSPSVSDNVNVLNYIKNAYNIYRQIQENYSVGINSFTGDELDISCNPRQKAIETFKKLYKGMPIPEYSKYEKVAMQSEILSIFGKTQYVIDSESIRISAIGNNKEIIVDYEFGEDESILVSSVEGKSIKMRECSLENLQAILKELAGFSEKEMARVALN